MAARKTYGPPPKGGSRLPVRLPDELRAAVKRRAEALALSESELVANLAAAQLGMPEPWPARQVDQLPLDLEIAA